MYILTDHAFTGTPTAADVVRLLGLPREAADRVALSVYIAPGTFDGNMLFCQRWRPVDAPTLRVPGPPGARGEAAAGMDSPGGFVAAIRGTSSLYVFVRGDEPRPELDPSYTLANDLFRETMAAPETAPRLLPIDAELGWAARLAPLLSARFDEPYNARVDLKDGALTVDFDFVDLRFYGPPETERYEVWVRSSIIEPLQVIPMLDRTSRRIRNPAQPGAMLRRAAAWVGPRLLPLGYEICGDGGTVRDLSDGDLYGEAWWRAFADSPEAAVERAVPLVHLRGYPGRRCLERAPAYWPRKLKAEGLWDPEEDEDGDWEE